MARQMLEKAKITAKQQYDRKTNPLVVSIWDKVMIVNQNRHKLEPVYQEPYVVSEIEDSNLVLYDESTKKFITIQKNNCRIY